MVEDKGPKNTRTTGDTTTEQLVSPRFPAISVQKEAYLGAVSALALISVLMVTSDNWRLSLAIPVHNARADRMDATANVCLQLRVFQLVGHHTERLQ